MKKNVIFMCEINNFVIFMVVISQMKCHILPQSIKEITLIIAWLARIRLWGGTLNGYCVVIGKYIHYNVWIF